MSRTRPAAIAGVALALALLAGPAVADAPSPDSPTPPEQAPVPTAAQLDAAVVRFTVNGVTRWSLDGSVTPLETTEQEQGETTITLDTDILFEPDEWDISATAADRIVELVQDIPDGATVQISGHTDSVVGAVDNQELSENRAEAVAAVITDARPDLDLDVAGYADSRPAVTENPDDPSSYAANRRVEIVYEG